MTQKILNVKNILRIIISVLIIFSMLKSCAKAAYTGTNYKGKTKDIYQNLFDIGWMSSNSIYSNATATQQYLDIIDDTNDNENIVIILETQTFYPQARKIYIYNNVQYSQTPAAGNATFRSCESYYCAYIDRGTWASNNSYYRTTSTSLTVNATGTVGQYYGYYWRYNGIWYEGLGSWYTSAYSLNNIIYGIQWEYATPNKLVEVSGFDADFYGMNRDYSIKNWKLGKLSEFNEYNTLIMNMYQIYTPVEQELIISSKMTKGAFGWSSNNGEWAIDNSGNVSVASRLVKYYPYYMIIYAMTEENEVADSIEAYFVFRPYNEFIPAVIGSGDYKGSGDYQIQDNTNILTETINSMFTMSESDIQDLRDRISGDLQLYQKAPVGQEISLLEGIENVEIGDFVISWSSVAYTDKNSQTPIEIIPSGEINFSQKVRENAALGTVHNYLQIIITGAMGYLIIYETWRIICIALGIGTQLYDNYEEENKIITTENENYNENTGITTVTIRNRKKGKTWSTTRSGRV